MKRTSLLVGLALSAPLIVLGCTLLFSGLVAIVLARVLFDIATNRRAPWA